MRRKSGLEWLHDKGKLNQVQAQAGERYGMDYRAALCDGIILVSNVEALRASGRGGGTKTYPGQIDWLTAAGQTEALRARDSVHDLFDHDSGAVAILAAICGKGMTAMEASGGNRLAAIEIEISLRAMLITMVAHYRVRDQGVKKLSAS